MSHLIHPLCLFAVLAVFAPGAFAAEVSEVERVTYDQLPDDSGFETPWAAMPITADRDPLLYGEVSSFTLTLAIWTPANNRDADQCVGACVSLAALADYLRTPYEAYAPAILLAHLQHHFSEPILAAALAKIVLHPEQAAIVLQAKDFGLTADPQIDAGVIRERACIYARKMLGRLLHRL